MRVMHALKIHLRAFWGGKVPKSQKYWLGVYKKSYRPTIELKHFV